VAVSKYNHRRYYNSMESRKNIGKFDIKTGMIVTFGYSGYDKNPLVFVMDTQEYVSSDKKRFSGINLNYLPIGEINSLFVKILQRVGWEVDKATNMPKIDLFDEEDPGFRVEPVFTSVVHPTLMARGKDCWRTYKYSKLLGTTQIVKFNFNISPLKEIMNPNFKKLSKISKTSMHKLLRGDESDFKPTTPKQPEKPSQPKKPKGGINENQL
jgi:hypothetical protein